MSKIGEEITKDEWVKNNSNFYDYYYENYPNLVGLKLPLDHSAMVDFYNSDQSERGLNPDDAMRNNYAFMFSYFLDNYKKKLSDKTKVKDFSDYVIEDVKKKSDVALNFGSDALTYVKYGAVAVGIYYIVQLLRGK